MSTQSRRRLLATLAAVTVPLGGCSSSESTPTPDSDGAGGRPSGADTPSPNRTPSERPTETDSEPPSPTGTESSTDSPTETDEPTPTSERYPSECNPDQPPRSTPTDHPPLNETEYPVLRGQPKTPTSGDRTGLALHLFTGNDWRESVREEFVGETCRSFVDDTDFRTASVVAFEAPVSNTYNRWILESVEGIGTAELTLRFREWKGSDTQMAPPRFVLVRVPNRGREPKRAVAHFAEDMTVSTDDD